MPTGYTSVIKDGISFKEFVMNCARAFGALVALRDDTNAPIPTEFKISPYHKNNLKDTEEKLLTLVRMTPKELDAHALAEYTKALDYHKQSITDSTDLKEKYNAMLAEVQRWKPPTDDHDELKKFMTDQITESIQFDCSTNYHTENHVNLLTGSEWFLKTEKKLKDDITYHTKMNKKEEDSVHDRNMWIKNLRESL